MVIDSILTSVKKTLGIAEDYTHFDADIVMHINSVFMILQQLGVGPKTGFYIEDDGTDWEEYVDNIAQLQMIKSYMYMKVRLLFDPPSSSTHMNALTQSINEFEWRLADQAEYIQ